MLSIGWAMFIVGFIAGSIIALIVAVIVVASQESKGDRVR